MNRTKIEWTDYTWNPVTGCWGPEGTAEKPNRCPYCYAQKIAYRFNWHRANTGLVGLSDPFEPQFWPARLSEPAKVKKPSKIFVCSMADLFGDWVPQMWIEAILLVAKQSPHHTFQFLTKNPRRLKDFNPWPANCWVGTTVTNQADVDERLPWLLQVEAPVRFVSHEPLLSDIRLSQWAGEERRVNCEGCSASPVRGQPYCPGHDGGGIDWAIIGGMTGYNAVEAKCEWVQGLIDQYRAAGVPCFVKDNLKWPEKIQEWPK
jgi:protein gp37